MSKSTVNKVVVFLTLIFLVLKLCYFFYSSENTEFLSYPDERNYYKSGASKFKEQGFSYFVTKRSLYNGPINILWVYIHPSFTSVKVSNIILMSLASLLIYFAFTNTFSHLTRILAWLIFSAYPLINHYSKTVLTEPPFIFLLVFSAFLFLKAKDKYLLYFFSGLIFSFATLVRPTTQYFPFFIIAILILLTISNRFRLVKINIEKKIIYNFLLFVLGALLLTTPWIVKNKVLFNKLGIATGSGAVLYLGNDHKKDGDEPIYSNMHFDTFEITKPYTHLDLEGDRKLTEEALSIIKKHPLDFLIISAKKTVKLLFGYPVDYFERRTNIVDFYMQSENKTFYSNLIELVLHVFLSVTFLYFLFTKSLSSSGTIFISGLYLYFLCLHSVSFPIPRLFLPAIVISMFSLPYTLNTKKSILAVTSCSILLVIFISFFQINASDSIEQRRIKFFATEAPNIIETKTRGFVNKNNFFIANKEKKKFIIYNFEKMETALNKVFLLNLSHSNNKNRVENSKVKLLWDSGKGFKNNNIEITYKKNDNATYLASPCIISNSWNKGTSIKRIKLIFNNLDIGDKIWVDFKLAK